ncbi:Cytochrome c oxidase [Macleaya cordata]|uniref:Cytochrome c oxidase n=1 Tax=Macleaya cordata TaxID=56857 RepID=A0A200R4Z8_MACCD|nr:Cytochrome c oxidase [Macleaya cordata]
MKSFNHGDFLKSPPSLFTKILAFALIAFAFFYLGEHWSDGYQQLVFFNTQQSDKTHSIAISPNANKVPSDPPAMSPSRPPNPPPVTSERFGIIDENGFMSVEFEVGSFDPELIEKLRNVNQSVEKEESGSSRAKIESFSLCSEDMRDYIPCLDNVEEISKLNSTEKGEKFERHCPRKDQSLDCLVPAPKDYRTPIPWPKSRDEVWFSNVPHSRLVEDKAGQNWILRDNDTFKFPGGGTQFIHGADQYLNQISQMVPDIALGNHTRVVLDVGCGVASFGAFLLSRNVTTLSIAPKDVHENQIQFALERGVPAMVAAFATRRLLYPSQAFDLMHCSRCRINWTRDDGILLLEVNRMLRAGGYFAWAAQPVYKHELPLQEQWKEMEDLTTRLCWELVKKEGYIAIWRKPSNNSCYTGRDAGTQPPLCDTNDDPDNVWYVGLKACISRLPENGYGANITTWPGRLHNHPDRLQSIQLDSQISRGDLFKAESGYWNDIIEGYIRIYHWEKLPLRNVMDMRAGFGGFAAALIDLGMDCWVMNVVPVSAPNTLPVIYDRGLIGVMHDWCEPFDTYPRTYDLLNACRLFSTEQKRCNISTIMLEMDRMLRPGGSAYIHDTITVMDEIQEVALAMGWHTTLRDTAEGPHAIWKLLIFSLMLDVTFVGYGKAVGDLARLLVWNVGVLQAASEGAEKIQLKMTETETPFRPRELLLEKQKLFQSIHKHTYLKGRYDKITSVIIPLGLTITCGAMIAQGIYNMSHGIGKKE